LKHEKLSRIMLNENGFIQSLSTTLIIGLEKCDLPQ
jgi:hypothetical protein